MKRLWWMGGAVLLGVAAGLLLGERAAALAELATWIVRALKALATPLVFFAIVDAWVTSDFPPRQGLRMLGISLLNASVACVLAITLVTLFRPGMGVQLTQGRIVDRGVTSNQIPPSVPKSDIVSALSDLVPGSIIEPFLKNNVLSVVLLALLFGAALRRLHRRGDGEVLVDGVKSLLGLLVLVLGWLVHLVPVAVFAIVAKVVGAGNFSVLVGLGKLLVTVVLGLFLQAGLWYSLQLKVLARRRWGVLFRQGWPALVTAFSTSSSLATMPETLRVLEQDLAVKPRNARLAACIATNLNNDGILLYEVVAALFVAQADSVTFTPLAVLFLALSATVASAGVAGVPEAGLMTLAVVLDTAGLSLAGLPVLLSVDWLLGRLRAATNAASDMTVAMLLERYDDA